MIKLGKGKVEHYHTTNYGVHVEFISGVYKYLKLDHYNDKSGITKEIEVPGHDIRSLRDILIDICNQLDEENE